MVDSCGTRHCQSVKAVINVTDIKRLVIEWLRATLRTALTVIDGLFENKQRAPKDANSVRRVSVTCKYVEGKKRSV